MISNDFKLSHSSFEGYQVKLVANSIRFLDDPKKSKFNSLIIMSEDGFWKGGLNSIFWLSGGLHNVNVRAEFEGFPKLLRSQIRVLLASILSPTWDCPKLRPWMALSIWQCRRLWLRSGNAANLSSRTPIWFLALNLTRNGTKSLESLKVSDSFAWKI